MTALNNYLQHVNNINRAFIKLALTNDHYPPHNIVMLKDNKYLLELAVAGFKKADLVIELLDQDLVVSGKHQTLDDLLKDDIEQYIHKGIAARAFQKRFTLDRDVKVDTIDLKDGMLKIYLTRTLPEERKPIKLDIGGSHQKAPEFLAEDLKL